MDDESSDESEFIFENKFLKINQIRQNQKVIKYKGLLKDKIN